MQLKSSFPTILLPCVSNVPSRGLRHWRAQRAEFEKIYNELAQMTDRDLTDIGISRGQIRDIAQQAAAAV